MPMCNKCIHFESCGLCKVTRGLSPAYAACDFFLDKSRFIELPCKPGTTVYEICNNTDACHDCQYYSEFYGMDELCDKLGDCVTCPTVSDEPLCEKQFYEIISHTPSLEWIFNYRHRFGETVFLSMEEAEEELKRRSLNEHNSHSNN